MIAQGQLTELDKAGVESKIRWRQQQAVSRSDRRAYRIWLATGGYTRQDDTSAICDGQTLVVAKIIQTDAARQDTRLLAVVLVQRPYRTALADIDQEGQVEVLVLESIGDTS